MTSHQHGPWGFNSATWNQQINTFSQIGKK